MVDACVVVIWIRAYTLPCSVRDPVEVDALEGMYDVMEYWDGLVYCPSTNCAGSEEVVMDSECPATSTFGWKQGMPKVAVQPVMHLVDRAG